MGYWFLAILVVAIGAAAWVRFQSMVIPAVLALMFTIFFPNTLPYQMNRVIWAASALLFAKILADLFMERKTN